MRLLPLLLSAHPSAWTADALLVEDWRRSLRQCQCCFCGVDAGRLIEPFHLNGDHAENRDENVVPACPLCHLAQHPDRPRIDDETVLIWMPEVSQAVLNRLVRGIHIDLHRGGETLDAHRPPRGASLRTVAAYRAYRALHNLSQAALDRLGTNSFAQLGAALLDLSPAQYGRRSALLGGLRLLPLGHLYDDQRDIYRDLMTAWAAKPQPPA